MDIKTLKKEGKIYYGNTKPLTRKNRQKETKKKEGKRFMENISQTRKKRIFK